MGAGVGGDENPLTHVGRDKQALTKAPSAQFSSGCQQSKENNDHGQLGAFLQEAGAQQ